MAEPDDDRRERDEEPCPDCDGAGYVLGDCGRHCTSVPGVPAVSDAVEITRLRAMHRKVHSARERTVKNPLILVQLRGVEDALDWVLGHCPDGDFGETFDPVEAALGTDVRIVVAHESDLTRLGL